MVVLVVVVGAGPEGHEMVQRPGKLVSRVGVDGAEQSERDPRGNGEKMHASGEVTVHQRNTDGSEAQERHFDGVGVLRRQPERRSVSVVAFMNIFVENTVVEAPVEPVMPGVLENEENRKLPDHGSDRREGNGVADTDHAGERVEEPDGHDFDHHVRDEHTFQALPLLFRRRKLGLADLVFVEVRDAVDDHPRNASAEVRDLVVQKEQEARGEEIIADVVVVGGPKFFNDVQRVVAVEVVEDAHEAGAVGAYLGVIKVNFRHGEEEERLLGLNIWSCRINEGYTTGTTCRKGAF